MSDRSSYDLKLDRAEYHLGQLETAIDAYANRHPYTVRERMTNDGQRTTRWFEFTEQPSDQVALIA